MSSYRSNSDPAWFPWFFRNFMQLKNVDPKIEWKKNYKSIYPRLYGYKGAMENPASRLSALSLIKGWNALDSSDRKKTLIAPHAQDQLKEFVQWFLYRVKTDEWVWDFIDYSNTMEGWFEVCESTVPAEIEKIDKLDDPHLFNPYLNITLTKIVASFVFPYIFPICESRLTTRDKEKLSCARALLERDELLRRTTPQTIMMGMFIALGLEEYDAIPSLAEQADRQFGSQSALFITAGNLLYFHNKEVEASQAYARQNLKDLKGNAYQLIQLGLYCFLFSDPRLPEVWESIEREENWQSEFDRHLDLVAILSVCGERVGEHEKSKLIWNQTIATQAHLENFNFLRKPAPTISGSHSPLSKVISDLIRKLAGKIES